MKRLFFFLWNFWPPFFGAGIKIVSVSKDFRAVRVRLKERPWTKNIVGTQYGGSLFSMTDPFYMVILFQQLGREYIVWDKAATIKFKKPGRTDIFADFVVTEDDIREIKSKLEVEPKLHWERTIQLKSTAGEVVAEVHKVISIKRKSPESKTF